MLTLEQKAKCLFHRSDLPQKVKDSLIMGVSKGPNPRDNVTDSLVIELLRHNSLLDMSKYLNTDGDDDHYLDVVEHNILKTIGEHYVS